MLEELYADQYSHWNLAQLDDWVREKWGNQDLHLEGKHRTGGYWHWHLPPKSGKYKRESDLNDRFSESDARFQRLEEENRKLRDQLAGGSGEPAEQKQDNSIGGIVERYFERIITQLGEEKVFAIADAVIFGNPAPPPAPPRVQQQNIEDQHMPELTEIPVGGAMEEEAIDFADIPTEVLAALAQAPTIIKVEIARIDWTKTDPRMIVEFLHSEWVKDKVFFKAA